MIMGRCAPRVTRPNNCMDGDVVADRQMCCQLMATVASRHYHSWVLEVRTELWCTVHASRRACLLGRWLSSDPQSLYIRVCLSVAGGYRVIMIYTTSNQPGRACWSRRAVLSGRIAPAR